MTEYELDEMERLWKGRKSATYIGRKLGYSASTIVMTACRDRSRFPRRRAKPTEDKTKELWLERIRAGRYTPEQVADKLGVHPQTVKKWMREERHGRHAKG